MNRTNSALTAAAVAAACLVAFGRAEHFFDGILPTAAAQEPRERERDERLARTDERDAERPVASIGIAQSEEHGEYLVDDQGRALYLLESDETGESTCYDECARAWPPVIAEGENIGAESGVDENLLGTIERRDGSVQVTYAEHPLYYYRRDREPGDTRGQDVTDEWGEWYLVTAEGQALEEAEDEGEHGQGEHG